MLPIDPVSLTALCATATAMYYVPKIGEARHRAHQLRNCEALLRAHNAAVATFTAHADAPPTLRRLVLDIADCLDDDDQVIAIARAFLAQEGRGDRRSEVSPAADEVAELARMHPELGAVFVDAVCNGFLAAFLRVPETARRWDDLVARIMSLGTRNTVRLAEVIPHRHHPTNHAGLLMPA